MRRKKATNKSHRVRKKVDQPGPMISFWVVAFLDILGYRSVLDKIDVFPFPDEGDGRRNLEASFARAIHLRRRLILGVNSFITSMSEAPDLSGVPLQHRSTAASWHRARLMKSPGPDHMVLACSLLPTAGHFPLRGVYNVVGAAASALITQLSLGADDPDDTLPLRGGIDLALGTRLQPEDVLYSPALTRAYDLESKEAIYPRIVAGRRLIAFLDDQVNLPRAGAETEFQRALAKRIRDMFFCDRDGAIVLDFLGSGVREALGQGEKASDIVTLAWRYAQRAYARISDGGNERVAAKYAWLVDYMRPRISAWSVAE